MDAEQRLWGEHAGPLVGLKVLDISSVIAGPFAGNLLADFGAAVIKVEQPGIGDAARGMGPFAQGESLRWVSLNRNKKLITLDLRQPKGAALFKQLVAWADVLLENFRPGTLDKWGLDTPTLRAVSPNLVVVHISGYGQTGPYAGKAGFGTPATAFAGLTYIQGWPDRPPISPPISIADLLAGIMGVVGALMAIYHRDVGGGAPQEIDVSLYESVFRLLEPLPAEYGVNGQVRERAAGMGNTASPVGTYQCSDGKWTVLVCSTDRTFNRLAQAIGRPDMIEDPRYCSNAERVKRSAEVDAIVSEWLGRHTLAEAQAILDQAGAPLSPVYSIADIFADPQYQAREDIITVDHPRLGKVPITGIHPRLTGTPGKVVHGGGEIGAHNQAIYGDLLGLGPDELAELKREGII